MGLGAEPWLESQIGKGDCREGEGTAVGRMDKGW